MIHETTFSLKQSLHNEADAFPKNKFAPVFSKFDSFCNYYFTS